MLPGVPKKMHDTPMRTLHFKWSVGSLFLFVCLFVCSETFEIYAVLYFFGKIYIVDRQNRRERSILHLLVCSPDDHYNSQ